MNVVYDKSGSAFKDGKVEFYRIEDNGKELLRHRYVVDLNRDQLKGLADIADSVVTDPKAFGKTDVFRGICYQGKYHVIHRGASGFEVLVGSSPADLKPGTLEYDKSVGLKPGCTVKIDGQEFKLGAAHVQVPGGVQVEAVAFGMYMTALSQTSLSVLTQNWERIVADAATKGPDYPDLGWTRHALLATASLQHPETLSKTFLHGLPRFIKNLDVARNQGTGLLHVNINDFSLEIDPRKSGK